MATARACTDRHGRVIECNAPKGMDAIFSTTCVKGGVRDRKLVRGNDGAVFLRVRLDLAAARNLDIAVGPNRIVLDRACLDLAVALDGETIMSVDARIPGSLGGDGAAVVNRDVVVCPDTIRFARGIDVARALDGETALGIDGVALSARGVDGAGPVDVDVAFGPDGVARRCHVERAGRVARMLSSAFPSVSFVTEIPQPLSLATVLLPVIDIELALGLDCTAVIAVELHIVGAVP